MLWVDWLLVGDVLEKLAEEWVGCMSWLPGDDAGVDAEKDTVAAAVPEAGLSLSFSSSYWGSEIEYFADSWLPTSVYLFSHM